MKSSFCIDLQRFMLIPTKFPLTLYITWQSNIIYLAKDYIPQSTLHLLISAKPVLVVRIEKSIKAKRCTATPNQE